MNDLELMEKVRITILEICDVDYEDQNEMIASKLIHLITDANLKKVIDVIDKRLIITNPRSRKSAVDGITEALSTKDLAR